MKSSKALAIYTCGALLTGCAVTPERKANIVQHVEDAYAVAHVAVQAYGSTPGANPGVVVSMLSLDYIAKSAIDAYAAAPADDGKAQAAGVATAALVSYATGAARVAEVPHTIQVPASAPLPPVVAAPVGVRAGGVTTP